MIYVSEENLRQVEYLIGQSIQGNHLLFDAESVRLVLGSDLHSCIEPEESYEVEHHIEALIQQPSLMQKRAYLEKLDSSTYAKVVRTYFNIVENNLLESLDEGKH